MPRSLGALQLATHDPVACPSLEQARSELLALRNEGDTSPDPAKRLIIVEAWLGDRDAVERDSEALLRTTQIDHWEHPRSEEQVVPTRSRADPGFQKLCSRRKAFETSIADTQSRQA